MVASSARMTVRQPPANPIDAERDRCRDPPVERAVEPGSREAGELPPEDAARGTRHYHSASCHSITPYASRSATPPGSVPVKLPNGWR